MQTYTIYMYASAHLRLKLKTMHEVDYKYLPFPSCLTAEATLLCLGSTTRYETISSKEYIIRRPDLHLYIQVHPKSMIVYKRNSFISKNHTISKSYIIRRQKCIYILIHFISCSYNK